MKRYVIGNWKCHKTSQDGLRWLDRFAGLYRPSREVEVVIAPSLVSLESLAGHLQRLRLAGVSLAAQDISPFPKGSYTGAVAADMVAGIAPYVLVGHLERRRYFHETDQEIINKVSEAADSNLVPIVCVEGRESLTRLAVLADLDCRRLLIAYTPGEALNSGFPAPPGRVQEMIAHIRRVLPASPVLYGGALLPSNVEDYLRLDSLAGLLVGGASLEPESFAEICNRVALGR